MKTLREMLWKEQKNLMDLLAKSNKNIAKHKALPQQHIQIATRNGHEQYYLYDASSKTKSYVKHEDMKNYSKLMQRDYELFVLLGSMFLISSITVSVTLISSFHLL